MLHIISYDKNLETVNCAFTCLSISAQDSLRSPGSTAYQLLWSLHIINSPRQAICVSSRLWAPSYRPVLKQCLGYGEKGAQQTPSRFGRLWQFWVPSPSVCILLGTQLMWVRPCIGHLSKAIKEIHCVSKDSVAGQMDLPREWILLRWRKWWWQLWRSRPRQYMLPQ